MSLAINTGTVGVIGGNVTVNLVFNGTGTSGLGTSSLGSQTFRRHGEVYRLALANSLTSTINFGNRHVGDSVQQTLSVQNMAATDGWSEGLNASFGTVATGLTSGGSITLLTAGSTSTSLVLGLSTTSVGRRAAA